MKKLSIILLTGLILTGLGCKKGSLDTPNPNNPTAVTPELVLPSAMETTASGQITDFAFLQEWMGYWAPSGSYAINASDLSTYKQTTNFGDGLWIKYYRNLEDYQYVETNATAQGKPFYEAAAKVMKAYVFQQLVDMFNNVPYTQALQGTKYIQPAYDNGQSIYESEMSDLTTAVNLFQGPNVAGTATSDVMFAGDASKWVQFANTLKLRMLMRQTQIPGRSAYIQAQIDSILSQTPTNPFLTTDAGVNPGYTSAQPNPFYASNINLAGTYIQDYWRANQYVITFDSANNDPRTTRLYAPTSCCGTYQGNVIGSATNHAANSASTFGPGILKSPSQSAILISAAESYFLQAEGSVRGFLYAGQAEILYDLGVQASFDYLGAGDASTYYNQPGNKNTTFAANTSMSDQIAVIIRQKWMAMNMVTPFEAWADYRRLHLPSDIPLSVSPYVVSDIIPFRIQYPTSEYNTNSTNVNAQGVIDPQSSKVFWMP